MLFASLIATTTVVYLKITDEPRWYGPFMPLNMKYCNQCGSSAIHTQIPAGDTYKRQVCQDCKMIFYSNPKIVVGAVVTFNNFYLLCRRNIEPQKGLWTYPAGFLEENETLEEGVIRETFEEAKAKIEINRLIGMYSLTAVNQVHLIYSAKMLSDRFDITLESCEVKLMKGSDIPWDKLAFPVIKWALKAHLDLNMQGKIDSKSTSLSLEDSFKLD